MNNLRCPRCGLSHIKKNGRTHYGKQNHACWVCGRQFVAEAHRIDAPKRAYDYVEGGMGRPQTWVTAVVAHAQRVEGVAVEVQFPNSQAEEFGDLNMTAQEGYPELESARQRFIDGLPSRKNRLSYRKPTTRLTLGYPRCRSRG